ncbi:MAG: hypothetical protein ACFFD4_08275 [Candidatus Odinarchaeota archaeon]
MIVELLIMLVISLILGLIIFFSLKTTYLVKTLQDSQERKVFMIQILSLTIALVLALAIAAGILLATFISGSFQPVLDFIIAGSILYLIVFSLGEIFYFSKHNAEFDLPPFQKSLDRSVDEITKRTDRHPYLSALLVSLLVYIVPALIFGFLNWFLFIPFLIIAYYSAKGLIIEFRPVLYYRRFFTFSFVLSGIIPLVAVLYSLVSQLGWINIEFSDILVLILDFLPESIPPVVNVALLTVFVVIVGYVFVYLAIQSIKVAHHGLSRNIQVGSAVVGLLVIGLVITVNLIPALIQYAPVIDDIIKKALSILTPLIVPALALYGFFNGLWKEKQKIQLYSYFFGIYVLQATVIRMYFDLGFALASPLTADTGILQLMSISCTILFFITLEVIEWFGITTNTRDKKRIKLNAGTHELALWFDQTIQEEWKNNRGRFYWIHPEVLSFISPKLQNPELLPENAKKSMISLLKHKNPDIQSQALEIIEKWSDSQIAPLVARVMIDELLAHRYRRGTDAEKYVQFLIKHGLLDSYEEELITICSNYMNDGGGGRIIAISILTGLPDTIVFHPSVWNKIREYYCSYDETRYYSDYNYFLFEKRPDHQQEMNQLFIDMFNSKTADKQIELCETISRNRNHPIAIENEEFFEEKINSLLSSLPSVDSGALKVKIIEISLNWQPEIRHSESFRKIFNQLLVDTPPESSYSLLTLIEEQFPVEEQLQPAIKTFIVNALETSEQSTSTKALKMIIDWPDNDRLSDLVRQKILDHGHEIDRGILLEYILTWPLDFFVEQQLRDNLLSLDNFVDSSLKQRILAIIKKWPQEYQLQSKAKSAVNVFAMSPGKELSNAAKELIKSWPIEHQYDDLAEKAAIQYYKQLWTFSGITDVGELNFFHHYMREAPVEFRTRPAIVDVIVQGYLLDNDKVSSWAVAIMKYWPEELIKSDKIATIITEKLLSSAAQHVPTLELIEKFTTLMDIPRIQTFLLKKSFTPEILKILSNWKSETVYSPGMRVRLLQAFSNFSDPDKQVQALDVIVRWPEEFVNDTEVRKILKQMLTSDKAAVRLMALLRVASLPLSIQMSDDLARVIIQRVLDGNEWVQVDARLLVGRWPKDKYTKIIKEELEFIQWEKIVEEDEKEQSDLLNEILSKHKDD